MTTATEGIVSLQRFAGLVADVLRSPIVTGARAAWTKPGAEARLAVSITLLLLSFGLGAVFSASTVESLNSYGNAWEVFLKQLLFAAVGVGCMFMAMRIPVRYIRAVSGFAAVGSIGLLILVLVIGNTVNGQRNWIPLPFHFANLQPSEFAKLGFILWAADQVARRANRSTEARFVAGPILAGALVAMALIALERDMGNLMVFGGIMVVMLFATGAPGRLIGELTAGGFAALIVVLYQGPEYRAERILNWRDPWSDPQGTGWQFIQGSYALALGGLFGQGPGASKEKWGALPEAHTDFILAVIGEEYGWIGTSTTLLLIFGLLTLLLRAAMRQRDPFRRTFIIGVSAWTFVQTVMNVGAVTQFLPIVGVTLPLVSYGGSSLLPLLIAIGLVVRCISEPEEDLR